MRTVPDRSSRRSFVLAALGVPLASALAACESRSAAGVPAPRFVSDETAAAAEELAPLELGGHLFWQRVLANGLRALAVQDAGEVSVFVVVAAGKRQETPETTGLAHLVEHAMYAGTERTPAGGHDARIHALGAESNAYTRDDYTLFYDHGFAPEHLAEVLALEADRLRGLTFEPAAVLHERKRLRVEEAETFEPDAARAELVESLVYRVHPYRAGVYDADGHTRAPALGVEAVRTFYERWYRPERTAVVVVGPREPAQMLAAVERAFGALERGPAPPPVPAEPAVAEPREHRLPSALARDRCELVWIVPELAHPDRPALALLARVLEERHGPDGAPVQAGLGGRVDRELFRVAATGPEARATAEQVVAEARAGEIEEAELALARRLVGAELAGLPLRARPYFSLAGAVGVYAALDRLDVLAGWRAAVDAVTAADLARVARAHLAPERRVTIVFEGTGAEPAPLPDDPQALSAAAQEAAAAGDYERAIAAYTRLLARDSSRMNTVIQLASRGQARMELADWDGAIADFERALAVVDYPAVRDLLHEAQERQVAATLRAPAGAAESAADGAAPRAADPSPPGPGSAPNGVSEPSHGAEESPQGAGESPHGGKATGSEGAADDAEPTRAAIAADLRARVDATRTELERWRGLAFRAPVELELVAEAEDEKLGGWYEPATDRLVVALGKSARFSRGTLLHELHHALQDQHFDLAALHAGARGPDEHMALDALIEGEAMLAVAELMDYDFERHAVLPESGPLDRERFEKIYRYGAGLRFVRALRERGGWTAVDAAFRRPPRTTAEILHPERYAAEPDRASGADGAAGEAAGPARLDSAENAGRPRLDSAENAALAAALRDVPLAPALAGSRVVADERRGELELAWLLARHAPTREAAWELAALLRADRFRALARDDAAERGAARNAGRDAAGGAERDGAEGAQWDLAFADAAAAERFVAQGGAAAEAQGFAVARDGRLVRLVRAW